MRVFGGITALILLGALIVHAQSGERKALIIGNNAYGIKAPFTSLGGAPVNDANAIEKALRAAGVQKITVLVDQHHDEFIDALYKFRGTLNDQDSIVFYFSGHGFSIDGQDYLVPIGFDFEGTKKKAAGNAISLATVRDILSKAPSRVLILDACRTAAPLLKSATRPEEEGSVKPMVMMQGTGSLVGFSTSGDRASSADSPGGGLSFFTYYLIKTFDTKPMDMLSALSAAKDLTSRASDNAQVPAIYNEMTYSSGTGYYQLFQTVGKSFAAIADMPSTDFKAAIQARTDKLLAVPQEVLDKNQALLTAGDGGIFRILPRGKYENEMVMRGGGAYYSFSRRSPEYGYGSDIELDQDQFSTGFAGADYGYFMSLGSVSLDRANGVTAEPPSWLSAPEQDAWKFLWSYSPPSDMSNIRKEQSLGARTVGATVLSRRVPMTSGQTYILRSISFDRSDVLVMLRVDRVLDDGSAVVGWKLLKLFATPSIQQSPNG